MAYAPPPGPPPQNFQQPNNYGSPNPATQPGGYPGTYPPQDQTPPYDQPQAYPTDDIPSAYPPPDSAGPNTTEYPEEGQPPDAAEYAADSGVYPAEVTAVELQNDELIQDEGVDENGEARVLAQADESITLEPLVSVPEGESVLEKETTVSISVQEKAKSTTTPKDTNQVTKSQQYYGTKQYPSSYYNTRQTRSKSRHRHRHRQSYNYNTNQLANQQQQQNCYSPCQIGVIPMRSAAFQAPRIPLPKLCNHLLPRDDGEPEEEDGVAFQFKPQTHCRTEVTFTIEPKPQPPWLTMLNCGFKPMVNCSAPPCYLSPNGNPGMDYMGGTQTVVNRAFGTEVQYSGMANFPTLQQIQSTFPGSGVIDASNMNKQKKNTRRHGRGSEEESGSSGSGSDEEESEGEQKPQIRSHRYSYQPAGVPQQHHAYNAQKHEHHHQQYQQQLAQYHAAHHRHHQQLHHHYQHYQNAIQNVHHSSRRKSREQSAPKKEVRHRSKVRKHVKPQDKQILHHHHHHHTGPHGHSSNKPIGEVVAKKSMAAAPRKSLVVPRKSLVAPHPHEHHHHHDHHRRSSATEEAYHYHDHDVDELSRSSDWHG